MNNLALSYFAADRKGEAAKLTQELADLGALKAPATPGLSAPVPPAPASAKTD